MEIKLLLAKCGPQCLVGLMSRTLEDIGNTVNMVRALVPQSMPDCAAYIGFITPLTATDSVSENNLNILGQNPNATIISPWEQKI